MFRRAPNADVLLKTPDQFVGLVPAVIVLADCPVLIRTAVPSVPSVSPVKPDLEDVPVVAQKFGKLVPEILDIGLASVLRVIAVPG